MIRCAASFSQEPLAGGDDAAFTRLVDDVGAQLGGEEPDLVLLFASTHHRERIPDLAARVRKSLAPRTFIGCSGQGLLAGDREIEGSPAVTLFAAHLPGATIDPFLATFEPGESVGSIVGFPLERLKADDDPSVILFADPFTFPVDELLHAANREAPGVPFLGGLVSGAARPGQNRLICDERVVDEGAVGVVLAGDVVVRHVVSQGCRPVGRYFVVTDCEGNVIQRLGGEPALAALQEVFENLSHDDRELLQRALHVGRAIDASKSTFGRGDFLVRSVTDIDQSRGSIAINDGVRRGQTVQFLVRDPASASEDLEQLLKENRPFLTRHPPRGVLIFSCNGRGSRMFGTPDHDAQAVRDHVARLPLAGFFAAGEVGPVGGQNFLHGFTASVGLLCERGDPT